MIICGHDTIRRRGVVRIIRYNIEPQLRVHVFCDATDQRFGFPDFVRFPFELRPEHALNFLEDRIRNGYIDFTCDGHIEQTLRLAPEVESTNVNVGVEGDPQPSE